MSHRSFLSAVLLLGLALPLMAAAQSEPAVERAVEWLRSQQRADGGYSAGFVDASDVGTTADAVLAFAGAGVDPSTVLVGARSPLTYLAEQMDPLAIENWGRFAKMVLAVQAAGLDVREFEGVNLVNVLRAAHDPVHGFQGDGAFDTSLIVLALANADEPLPEQVVQELLAFRLDDGSFSFSGDRTPGAGDSNTTAMVIQALVASGARDQIGPSLDYLRAVQNDDGGWTYQKPSAYGEETDANSTALVIQALEASGEDLRAWGDPIQVLRSFQLPSGAFFFNRSFTDENLLATLQAIPAMAGVDFTEIPSLGDHLKTPEGPLPSSTGIALITLAALAVVLLTVFVAARRRS